MNKTLSTWIIRIFKILAVVSVLVVLALVVLRVYVSPIVVTGVYSKIITKDGTVYSGPIIPSAGSAPREVVTNSANVQGTAPAQPQQP